MPVVVKAQVPAGKRGKAGGILTAGDPRAAHDAATAILGMEIAGHRVASMLVEERAEIAAEYYAAVLGDAASKGPLVMFSPEGGMDVEEIAATAPDRLRQTQVDILHGFDLAAARAMLGGLGLGEAEEPVASTLAALYRAWRENDAELLEVNSAGAARGRAAGRARLQAHPRRFRHPAQAGARGHREPGPAHGAGGARGRPKVSSTSSWTATSACSPTAPGSP